MRNIFLLLSCLLCLQACNDEKEVDWTPDALTVSCNETLEEAGDGHWKVTLPTEYKGTVKLEIQTDKAWEVAKRLAKPNNSMAVRHLKGFLSMSKKYEKDFMDKVYGELLKKAIISFRGFRDALQKVEQTEGVRYKKKRLKHGTTLDVIDCRSVRGAEYYKDRFNH